MDQYCECCERDDHRPYYGFLDDLMMVALCPNVERNRIVFIDGAEMPFVRESRVPSRV